MQSLRQQLERWDNPDSLVFFQSTSGGTGSGLSAKLFQEIETEVEYKMNKIWIALLPSPNLSVNHIEHYNTIMWLSYYWEYINMGIMLDNQAWFKHANDFLGLKKSSYRDVNKIVAKMYSDLTAGFRYETAQGTKNLYLSDMVTDLVPFKNMNSLYTTMVPLIDYIREKPSKLKQVQISADK